MLRKDKVMAFAPTTDPARAKKFYRDTLGLRMVKEQMPFALVFDLAGIMLRVTVVPKFQPHPFTVLGWQVPNVKTKVRQLAKHGVIFERYPGMQQDEDGIWHSPDGGRIAWFKDPDGNTLSLAQIDA